MTLVRSTGTFSPYVYANRYEQSGYDDLQPVVGGKPMTIGECAKLPTPAVLAARPRGVFFMA